MAIPTYDNLFNPLIKALHNLGGSASIAELEDEVARILKLTDEIRGVRYLFFTFKRYLTP